MLEKLKNVLLVFLGMVCAVVIFCIAVDIGCSVNGLTFLEQITQWFEIITPAVEEVTEVVATIPPVV